MLKRLFLVVSALVLVALAAPLRAQTPRDGRLLITVADPSGAIIPKATVTVVDQGDASRSAALKPATTSDRGVATIEGVPPGRYTIQAEFPGFEIGTLKDVRVRTGDNKHIVILPLKRVEQSVTVGQEAQAAAADPRGNAVK